jgi:hypothetical protein
LANQDDIQNLLKQGVEAARAGDRERAKDLLQQVTDLDSNNERAWFLLANLTDDPEEKRIYLENVLYINPGNEKAQQMLKRLNGGSTSRAAAGGGGRRQIYIAAGFLVAFLILEALFVVVGTTRRSSATATAVAFDATSTSAQGVILTTTAIANTTATAVFEETSAAQTEVAATLTNAPTATPTIDPTTLTLPPTWTPTDPFAPTATELPSEEDTAARAYPPPPAEQFSGQFIVGWGGFDDLNIGFLPMLYMPLDDPGSTQQIGDQEINNVDVNPANGDVLAYTRYSSLELSCFVEYSDINGEDPQVLSATWRGVEPFVNRPQQAQFSQDGSKLVFVGQGETNTYDVYMLDLLTTVPPNQSALTQLTEDDSNYIYPSISPDGSQVIAVRTDPQPDIVSIDVATREITEITSNGSRFVESHLRFSADGSAIYYVVAEDVSDPEYFAGLGCTREFSGDILRQPLAAGTNALPVVRTPNIEESHPVPSPDGRYIAFASNETGVFNIYIKDLQTEEIYQLTADDQDPVYPGGWYQPDAVPQREAVLPLPTPVIIEEDETGAS